MWSVPVVTLTVLTEQVDAEIVRSIERGSIRAFLENHLDVVSGNILDFGAGEQPYRDLLEQKGNYCPYDRADFPCSRSHVNVGDLDAQTWDTVVSTQVIQYLPNPAAVLTALRSRMSKDSYILLTFPTTWEEIEDGDLYRFTSSGMRRLLRSAGFVTRAMEERARLVLGGNNAMRPFIVTLGYGVVAQPI